MRWDWTHKSWETWPAHLADCTLVSMQTQRGGLLPCCNTPLPHLPRHLVMHVSALSSRPQTPEQTTQFNVGHHPLPVTFYPIGFMFFIKLKSILIHVSVDPWDMSFVRAVTCRAISCSPSLLRTEWVCNTHCWMTK